MHDFHADIAAIHSIKAVPRILEVICRTTGMGSPRLQQGLGLGLYNSSEIARKHGGTLAVKSLPEETRFTFRMPVG